jgi:hypothetical protein
LIPALKPSGALLRTIDISGQQERADDPDSLCMKKARSHTRGCIEIASFVLESVAEASRNDRLDEQLLRMCESALETLRQV